MAIKNLRLKASLAFALISVVLTLLAVGCVKPTDTICEISWRQLPPLPPSPSQTVQPGLAGALIGVSNDALIVAGGSNFPGKPVWEKGSKSYYDDIYVLLPDMEWKTGFKLPYKLGYSTTLMIDDRMVCIGGHDGNSARREVFSMEWDGETERIVFDSLPSLPVPMAKTAGAVLGNFLYVVGGTEQTTENGRSVNRPSNSLYYLDMDRLENGWQKGPSFPGPARQKTHAASQWTPEGECLFIFSGMAFPPEENEPDVMTDGLCYNPRTRRWKKNCPYCAQWTRAQGGLQRNGDCLRGKKHPCFGWARLAKPCFDSENSKKARRC